MWHSFGFFNDFLTFDSFEVLKNFIVVIVCFLFLFVFYFVFFILAIWMIGTEIFPNFIFLRISKFNYFWHFLLNSVFQHFVPMCSTHLALNSHIFIPFLV